MDFITYITTVILSYPIAALLLGGFLAVAFLEILNYRFKIFR